MQHYTLTYTLLDTNKNTAMHANRSALKFSETARLASKKKYSLHHRRQRATMTGNQGFGAFLKKKLIRPMGDALVSVCVISFSLPALFW
jgi:hypothetical protein